LMRLNRVLVLILASALALSSMFVLRSESTGASKKLQILLLENGIFDCAEVLNSINGYLNSISSLGFETSIYKISNTFNNELGIDALIENKYNSEGIGTFILVGNDLKFPLRTGDDLMTAAPADGVLCDTNHELSFEGFNQTVKAFTSEVTVSYIFPPKIGLSTSAQRTLVVNAFNKFERFHQGSTTYSSLGIACGRFDNDFFREAISRMASASETLFGKENTIEKELTYTEIAPYFEKKPAYLGVAGHGSPYVVETSSTGTILDGSFFYDCKSPLLVEIVGCWVSGWNFENINDPWSARSGTLSMSCIFNNDYTLAVVAGFPESEAGYSFSTNILAELKRSPNVTLGELMQNKARRGGDWVLFGDPTLLITPSTGENGRPVASIEYISPTVTEQGSTIYFKGSGLDNGGTITGYSWRSSLDGELSTSSYFSSATLSAGTHTIYFRVRDNEGEWSEDVEKTITILSAPTVYIASPINQQTVEGAILINVNAVFAKGTLRAIAYYVDGKYIGYDSASPYEYPWDTLAYKNGVHYLKVVASFENPVRSIVSTEIAVTVDNPMPTVVVIAPANNSVIEGSCIVSANASNVDKATRANFYVDSVFVGNDYSYPFEWTWDTTTKQNGLHEIFIEVYYSHIRQYVSSPKVIAIVENPKIATGVTILSPANGSIVGATVLISVHATGQDLNRVYFYIDGQWKGYAMTAPFTLEWNTMYVPDGIHEIYATAYYGKNPPYQRIDSETIRILVDNHS
jgi:hypothetical protein